MGHRPSACYSRRALPGPDAERGRLFAPGDLRYLTRLVRAAFAVCPFLAQRSNCRYDLVARWPAPGLYTTFSWHSDECLDLGYCAGEALAGHAQFSGWYSPRAVRRADAGSLSHL